MLAAILILVLVAVVAGYVIHRRVVARRREGVEIVDDGGERHRIPLPPLSFPIKEIPKTNEYFTTSTIWEIKHYVDRTLPEAGWTFVDVSRVSLATSMTFRQDDKRLHLRIERRNITFGSGPSGTKLTITIAVNVKPSSLEQELTAIEMLSKAGNKDAVEPLIALLSDQRARIRREAMSALTIIRDERSLQPLIDRLKDDDSGVRQAAASALGEFGSKQAVEALIVGLETKDHLFQTNCAYSLGKIKDKRAVAPLIAVLDIYSWRLTIHAAWALGEIGDRSSVEPLIACVKDPESNVQLRVMVFLALKKLLDAAEISALLQEMSMQLDQPSFEDELKNVVPDNFAELGADIVFDLFGIDH